MIQLTDSDKKRYHRQMLIPGFGEEGQKKLKSSKVFLGGAGGLGSPIATYLAVAGVGHIKIVDKDAVELSNLNRQILHWNKNIGQEKAISAYEKLTQINPDIKIEALVETIAEDNVLELVGDADVIMDGMDNFPTRYLLNEAAVKKGIPFIHGSIYGMEGQATTIIPGKTPCLRCLYPEAPPREVFPVLGATPAFISTVQVMEAIKYLTGIGNLLAGRLLFFDGENMEFNVIPIKRVPECPVCGNLGCRV